MCVIVIRTRIFRVDESSRKKVTIEIERERERAAEVFVLKRESNIFRSFTPP